MSVRQFSTLRSDDQHRIVSPPDPCGREGTPRVVIDTGIAERMDRWKALQQRIAGPTRVITYNRAGYGASETFVLRKLYDYVADRPACQIRWGTGKTFGPFNAYVPSFLRPARKGNSE